MDPIRAGPRDEDDEGGSRKREDDPVEAEPGAGAGGLSGGEILVVADVFDGREGEGEALGELDAADNGEGDYAVEEGHEAGSAKEEEDGGGGDSGGHDLGYGEVGGLGDGDGGDGLHGLDRHGDGEKEASEDVVEGGEDEGGGEVEVVDEGESEDDGDVGAEVADGAAQLRPDRGLEAEAGGEGGEEALALAPPLVGEEERGCRARIRLHGNGRRR